MGNEIAVGNSGKTCRTVIQIKLIVNVLGSFSAVGNRDIQITIEIKISPGMAF